MGERLNSDSFVAVIMGPSGVGKDTLIDSMLKIDDLPHIYINKSWTTRAHRSHEPENRYHYASEAEFRAAEHQGLFLETSHHIYGHWYGAPWPEVLPENTIEVFNVLPEGAKLIKKQFLKAKLYLIEPPSIKELRRRLEARGNNDQVDLDKREKKAIAELTACRKIADHRIINETDHVYESAHKLHSAIRADWLTAKKKILVKVAA